MGTYNYPARELADEINTLLNNLEGDFQLGELEKALGLVAVEHTLALDGGNRRRLLRSIETLAWIIIEYGTKGYISGNDIDIANNLLNKAQLELRPRRK